MQKNSIYKVVEHAIQYLTKSGYSSSAVRCYSWVWKKLIKFAKEKLMESYSSHLCEDFMAFFVDGYPGDNISHFGVTKIRALRVLDDLFHNRPIKKKYMTKPVYVPICFQVEYDSYNRYMAANGHKPQTIATKRSRILVFLRYLEGIAASLYDLNFQMLINFREYLSKHYNMNTKANIEFTVRDFLNYAESEGLVTNNMSVLFGTIYSNKHGRLPSTYTVDEIGRILSTVDRTTVSGKRDYSLLTLMIMLGLRSSDLCSLRLSTVHCESHSLVFQQQKTGNFETLPLTEVIEMALADYLKNARPEGGSDHLFVRCIGVHKDSPLTPGIVYTTLNRYMKNAGIETEGKRHGPHSIRHSLSSNLLKEGVPIPVIAGILGHGSSEITTRYLWMDTEQLRALALEVQYEE